MTSTIGAAWLTPTSIEPRLFANRDKERQLIEEILEDLLRSHARRYRLVIFGDRGIGKSILTSVASQNFAARYPNRVVRVEVNGRMIGFRQFLKALAGGLVEQTRPLLSGQEGKETNLARWLDELALLAHNDQVSEGQIRSLTTKYGIGAQAGGSLFDLLTGSGSFTWDQTRQQSSTTNRVKNVNDDVLHDALKATLQKIHDETALTVLVFFDDLDQALTSDDQERTKQALKRILDVDPCVGLVHMRTEMLFDDLRREMDDQIDIHPLSESGLLAVIEKRLDAATTQDKTRFRHADVQTALHRLTRATGNPLVFLRWVQGFLRTRHWPPSSETSWSTEAVLLEVASRASIAAGVEDELLARLAFIVDRCVPRGQQEVQKRDLLDGRLKTDSCDDGRRITADEFALLVRTGMLIPKDRFREEAGYRMDPVLDLLRPSVAARLREP